MKYISNKILKINLNSKKNQDELIAEEKLRKYLGGCALGAKILYDEVPPDVNWDDNKNRLINDRTAGFHAVS